MKRNCLRGRFLSRSSRTWSGEPAVSGSSSAEAVLFTSRTQSLIVGLVTDNHGRKFLSLGHSCSGAARAVAKRVAAGNRLLSMLRDGCPKITRKGWLFRYGCKSGQFVPIGLQRLRPAEGLMGRKALSTSCALNEGEADVWRRT
jgi:hypothetical protein